MYVADGNKRLGCQLHAVCSALWILLVRPLKLLLPGAWLLLLLLLLQCCLCCKRQMCYSRWCACWPQLSRPVHIPAANNHSCTYANMSTLSAHRLQGQNSIKTE
jgi:hypothetical protein